jgi:hypothetical protein
MYDAPRTNATNDSTVSTLADDEDWKIIIGARAFSNAITIINPKQLQTLLSRSV